MGDVELTAKAGGAIENIRLYGAVTGMAISAITASTSTGSTMSGVVFEHVVSTGSVVGASAVTIGTSVVECVASEQPSSPTTGPTTAAVEQEPTHAPTRHPTADGETFQPTAKPTREPTEVCTFGAAGKLGRCLNS